MAAVSVMVPAVVAMFTALLMLAIGEATLSVPSLGFTAVATYW